MANTLKKKKNNVKEMIFYSPVCVNVFFKRLSLGLKSNKRVITDNLLRI